MRISLLRLATLEAFAENIHTIKLSANNRCQRWKKIIACDKHNFKNAITTISTQCNAFAHFMVCIFFYLLTLFITNKCLSVKNQFGPLNHNRWLICSCMAWIKGLMRWPKKRRTNFCNTYVWSKSRIKLSQNKKQLAMQILG